VTFIPAIEQKILCMVCPGKARDGAMSPEADPQVAASTPPDDRMCAPDSVSRPVAIKFGTYKGTMTIPQDFDAPDQDIIDMFDNSNPVMPEQR
jgi:hypothetical protein